MLTNASFSCLGYFYSEDRGPTRLLPVSCDAVSSKHGGCDCMASLIPPLLLIVSEYRWQSRSRREPDPFWPRGQCQLPFHKDAAPQIHVMLLSHIHSQTYIHLHLSLHPGTFADFIITVMCYFYIMFYFFGQCSLGHLPFLFPCGCSHKFRKMK